MNDAFTLAELNRRFHALVIFGTVSKVDHANRRLKVKEGELETGWLQYPAANGRNFKIWTPIRKGQQFVVLCRGGDPAQGVIVGELYSDSINSPSVDDNVDVIQFDNGNKVEHNAATGQITIVAKGNVVVEKGNVQVPNGDVIASGVSLMKHTHGKTTPGKGSTGKPN